MALTELFYNHQNTTRQLARTMPGPVYPRGSSIIPYTENTVYYVGYKPGVAIGSTVTVYIDDVEHGTTTILDAEGFFVYGFVPGKGVFEFKTKFADDSTYSKFYTATNVHMFLSIAGDAMNTSKIDSIVVLDNLFLNYNDIYHIGNHARSEAFAYLGSTLGFRQPFDWTATRYATVLGGDQINSIPGVLPTIRKGSTTGAIKDIVYTVTGNAIEDAAFTTLQTIKWMLPRDGVKWIWDGGVVETDNLGPHYFVKGTGVLATPTAIIDSGIRKAFTILLNIDSDGIYTSVPDTVIKSDEATDNLFYSYLNPWAPPINVEVNPQFLSDTVANGITLPEVYEASSLRVYLNGTYIAPEFYTINASREIVLDVALLADPADRLSVDFIESGITRYTETFEIASSLPSGDTLQLDHFAIEESVEVYLNSDLIDDYTFDYANPDLITIDRALADEDVVTVVYAEVAAPVFRRVAEAYAGVPLALEAENEISNDYVRVFVNGVRQYTGYTLEADDITITIDDVALELETGDIVEALYSEKILYGYNVRIIDMNDFEYSQGAHFTVNYTTGEVIWTAGRPNPTLANAYNVYYTYFQKDILDTLLGLVKPAPIILRLQFTTVEGEHIFKPYYFFGVPNPTGAVIF